MNIISEKSECKIQGFHGTDLDCISKIDTEGFKIVSNESHWIANGVYFFLDREKAENWTQIQHQQFGVKIYTPVVIEVTIDYKDKKNLCDLRNHEDFMCIKNRYNEFMNHIFKKGVIKDSRVEIINNVFFEWVKQIDGFKVFIVGFDKTSNRDAASEQIKKKMKIPYVEYQMCVCDIDYINIKGYYNVQTID